MKHSFLNLIVQNIIKKIIYKKIRALDMKAEKRKNKNPSDEVYLVQNPALGAALVWKFVEGYESNRSDRFPTLPLLFTVLPILYHKELRDTIKTTYPSSGLRIFAAKFKSEQEVLYGIQDRMLRLRELSLSSISIALQCGLIQIDTSSAEVMSQLSKPPKTLPNDIKEMMKLSRKLGLWFETLTIQEVQTILRVKF